MALLERPWPLAAVSAAFGAVSTAWLLAQSPNFLSGYDYQRMHIFYRAFYRGAVLGGHLPLWNPLVELGRPFLADIETEALYPPNLLSLPFGPSAGVSILVALHQAIAFFWGTRLSRRLGSGFGPSLFAGAGFALIGPFVARLATGAVPMYFSACWWPALLCLGSSLQDSWRRGTAAAFAAVSALTVLAGNPPFAYIEFLGLFVFLAFRAEPSRELARSLLGIGGVAAAGLLGALAASAQIVPFAELVGQGSRPLHDLAFATADGMPRAGWLSLVFRPSEAFRPNWEYDLYCGLVPLLAAASGLALWRDRNARGLMALGLVGALFAAGDRLPVLGWATHILPGAGALRVPSRYSICIGAAILGLAPLAISRRPKGSLFPLGLLLAAAVGGCAWLAPHVLRGSGSGYLVSQIAVLSAVTAAVGLWLVRPSALLACVLAAFCAVDWMWEIRQQAPLYSLYGYRTEEAAVARQLADKGLVRPGEPPPRIAIDRSLLCENAGMAMGFSTFSGYANPPLRRVWSYLHAASGTPWPRTDFIQLPRSAEPRLRSLPTMSTAADVVDRGALLVVRPSPDPRAYLVQAAVLVPGWQDAENRITHGFDVHSAALVEETGLQMDPSGRPPSGAARITGFSNGRISVAVDAPGRSLLVLDEPWYPGWRAAVNGSAAAVVPVNGWMRGIPVPGGHSEVVLRFSPRSFRVGLAGSLAGLCAIAFLGRPRRKGAR